MRFCQNSLHEYNEYNEWIWFSNLYTNFMLKYFTRFTDNDDRDLIGGLILRTHYIQREKLYNWMK